MKPVLLASGLAAMLCAAPALAADDGALPEGVDAAPQTETNAMQQTAPAKEEAARMAEDQDQTAKLPLPEGYDASPQLKTNPANDPDVNLDSLETGSTD